MEGDAAENPPPAAEGQTEEQRLEQLKKQQEEMRQKQEEERLKRQQEIKKLKEALKGGLTGLARTADCGSMCYSKLSIAEKEIERLYDCLLDYRLVRYLDISTNAISNIQLVAELPELLSLNASKNQIAGLEVFQNPGVLKNLQFLNLSGNKIAKFTQVALPALRRLNLNENEIATIEGWNGHDTIQYLELRKNKLKKLTGLKNMKSLVELYLSENQISDFRGLTDLPNLKKLYLRNNKIKKLLKPFPHLPSLYHINLRENQLEKIVEFNKIEKHVKSITFSANPASDELGENAKKEMVWVYPHLQRINKTVVSLEQRVEFEKELQQKLAERERQRLEKEAQEAETRRLAEEQEAQARRAAEQQAADAAKPTEPDASS